MTSDKERLLGSNKFEDRRSLSEQICIHRDIRFFTELHFNCNVHQYSLDGNISAESFPFLPEIFFVKDCIEELTRFVAAVK